MKSSRNTGIKKGKKEQEIPRNQRPITSFFGIRGGGEPPTVRQPQPCVPSLSSGSGVCKNGNNRVSMAERKNVRVRASTSKGKGPVVVVDEITFSDSDSDNEDVDEDNEGESKYFLNSNNSNDNVDNGKENRSGEELKLISSPAVVSASEGGVEPQSQSMDFEDSSGDTLLSQLNVEEIINSSQENKDRNGGFSPDSSGDEILSQLDVDEIINSSQENKERKGDVTPDSSGDELLSQLDVDEIIRSSQEKKKELSSNDSSIPESKLLSQASSSPTKVVNLSPLALPKAKVNRFSPARKLNTPAKRSSSVKRSHSGSSLHARSVSPSSLPGTSQERRDQSSGTPDTEGPRFKRRLFQEDNEEGGSSRDNYSSFPIYLKKFMDVVCSVFNDSFHSHLFNEWDKDVMNKFLALDMKAKCLYVKLFQRQWRWIVVSQQKKYEDISHDLIPIFDDLHSSEFLVDIKDANDITLPLILKVLSAEQVTNLAQQMNAVAEKKTKTALLEALIKLGNQKSVFSKITTSDKIKTKAFEIMGPTYQLEGNHRSFFRRLFDLYSPPQYWEDEQQQSFFTMMKITMSEDGRMSYPLYTINRQTVIYENREQLIRFQKALSIHTDVVSHMENTQDWEEIARLGEESKETLQRILEDEEVMAKDRGLPSFLRVYREGSVLARVVWMSVEAYQKLNEYKKANTALEFLLEQDTYIVHCRGRWYERIAINQKHLKIPLSDRLKTLQEALNDQFLEDAHKLCLSDRFMKIVDESKRKRKQTKKRKRDLEEEVEDQGTNFEAVGLYRLRHEVPTRKIKGQKLINPTSGKSTFISKTDGEGTSQASSVEEFAIRHYKKSGYIRGVHSEGSVVTTIFGLLFWDEIYTDEISDSFPFSHQAFPLDLNFEEFFTRREGILTDKLQGMCETWTMETALDLIKTNWTNHCDKLSIVSWSVFPNFEQAQSLVKVMGLNFIAKVCERLAKNYRHHRSGFPDVVMWNDTDFLFAEVKGPGDTLSDKQKIWLDFLISAGAKAEVCLVEDSSNKRLN